MPKMPRSRNCALMVALAVAGAGCGRQHDLPAPPPVTSASPQAAPPTERVVGPLSAEDAAALATMNHRIREYVRLHIEVERTLPKLPAAATPGQIHANQREFETRLRAKRAGARPGDIFTQPARPVILRLLASVFSGSDGAQLKASIRDDNPQKTAPFRASVNARYPDTVPVSTVPLQVLQTLPALTEDLEYRFIGRTLIILDTHAHTIADFINNAIPS